MTLNGAMAIILRYFSEFGSLFGAHCIKVVELKIYTQTFSDENVAQSF